MATYEELIAKSKELAAAGDMENARRVAEIALKARASKKSFGTKVRENLIGDDDPTTQNFGEKVGSFLNKAGEAMTFGLVGDEASAAAAALIPGGRGYDEQLAHEREQEALFERENRAAALGAEIGGSLAGIMVPGLGTLGTLGKGASVPARMATSAGLGAAGGGTYGFMEGEGVDDRIGQGQTGVGLGAIVGALVPAVGAGVQKVANNRAANRAIRQAAEGAPSTDELRAMGRAAYNQIDNAGVQIKPQSFQAARDKVRQALLDKTGFDPLPGPGGNTPKAARVLQTMDEMAKDSAEALPFKSLDQVRRRAASPMLSADKVEQGAGREIIGQLDDYVRNMGPDDVVAGDVKTLQEVLPKARDLWARMSRSQLIDDAAGLGEEAYMSGSGSGIKYQFKKILKSPQLSKGFSEAERKAMARVVNGTIPEQVLRLAGSGLTQIGGTIAAATGGGPLAALGVLGATTGARSLSDKVIQRNAEIVRALVANGKLKALPAASDTARRITESLLRRTAAVGPH